MNYKPKQPPTGHVNTKQLLAAWKASSYINVQHAYFSAFYKGRKLLLLISNVGNLWFARANWVTSQINRPEIPTPIKAVPSEKGIHRDIHKRKREASKELSPISIMAQLQIFCKAGPAPCVPCSHNLYKMLCLVMEQMHIQWLVHSKLLFADSKSNVCWRSVIHWLQNYP